MLGELVRFLILEHSKLKNLEIAILLTVDLPCTCPKRPHHSLLFQSAWCLSLPLYEMNHRCQSRNLGRIRPFQRASCQKLPTGTSGSCKLAPRSVPFWKLSLHLLSLLLNGEDEFTRVLEEDAEVEDAASGEFV